MITPTLLRQWSACWEDDLIADHFRGRTALTPREIADDESISLNDRVCVLCRSIWHLDESAARMFAIESASLVSHLSGDDNDQAIYSGLLNDLIQIEEEIDDPSARAAARSAARSAARAAAWDAAWDDAWDDAWYAAKDAARSAAWDAAWDAARDAARSAAWDDAWYAAKDAARSAAWDAAKAAAKAAAWDAARGAARGAAWDDAWDAAIRKTMVRALEWLGDYADGWEEES